MTNIESIAQAYARAHEAENSFTTRFRFEGPEVVYSALLRKYGIGNNGFASPVEGGFISARAKRVSPFFTSNLNQTSMVRGTVVVSGFSETGRDQLVHGIIDVFNANDSPFGLHRNPISFGYELVTPYQRSTVRTLEPLSPSD